MIAMLDSDRSGKLGYEEFKSLWTSLRTWKVRNSIFLGTKTIIEKLQNVWTLYDTDKSGTFSGFELRNCLESAGYQLNNRVLNILMHRYGNRNGEIKFDDFIMCACKVKTMIGKFFHSKFEFFTNFLFF